MIYSREKQRFAELAKSIGEKEANGYVHFDPDFLAIENAEHLDNARQILRRMGFVLFNP
jgi:hypothetical protein